MPIVKWIFAGALVSLAAYAGGLIALSFNESLAIQLLFVALGGLVVTAFFALREWQNPS